jgi:hypothetical protein
MRAVADIRPRSVYWLPHVAKGLGISIRTLQRHAKAGRLKAVRAGLHTFVTGQCLLAWLEGRTERKRTRRAKDREAAQV